MTLKGVSEEVAAHRSAGASKQPSGHIPFTPRAKKTLELSLREALQLKHNYIGTEHILLGLIREGEGVAAQIMREARRPDGDSGWRYSTRCRAGKAEEEGESAGTKQTNSRAPLAAPAADQCQSTSEARLRLGEVAGPERRVAGHPRRRGHAPEATRLAGELPVGSHHLLLAALADSESAAARALQNLGVDLDQAKEALRSAEVAGTTDEQPEQAGRRHMIVRIAEDKVTIEAADPLILVTAQAALRALGDEAVTAGEIRGDQRRARHWPPSGKPSARAWPRSGRTPNPPRPPPSRRRTPRGRRLAGPGPTATPVARRAPPKPVAWPLRQPVSHQPHPPPPWTLQPR